jgi:hypothetical protein
MHSLMSFSSLSELPTVTNECLVTLSLKLRGSLPPGPISMSDYLKAYDACKTAPRVSMQDMLDALGVLSPNDSLILSMSRLKVLVRNVGDTLGEDEFSSFVTKVLNISADRSVNEKFSHHRKFRKCVL